MPSRQVADGRAGRAVAFPVADKSKRWTVNPWGTLTRVRGASAKPPRTCGGRTCSEGQHTPGLTVRVLANAAIDNAPAWTAQSLGVVGKGTCTLHSTVPYRTRDTLEAAGRGCSVGEFKGAPGRLLPHFGLPRCDVWPALSPKHHPSQPSSLPLLRSAGYALRPRLHTRLTR